MWNRRLTLTQTQFEKFSFKTDKLSSATITSSHGVTPPDVQQDAFKFDPLAPKKQLSASVLFLERNVSAGKTGEHPGIAAHQLVSRTITRISNIHTWVSC